MLKKLARFVLKRIKKLDVRGGHTLHTDPAGNLCVHYYVTIEGEPVFEDSAILFRNSPDRIQSFKEKKQFKNPKK